jgi:hypothetical protein
MPTVFSELRFAATSLPVGRLSVHKISQPLCLCQAVRLSANSLWHKKNIQAAQGWAKRCSRCDSQLAISVGAALADEIIAPFAGEMEQAHAEACQIFSSPAWAKRIDGDIAICTKGGYMADQFIYWEGKLEQR